MATSKKVDITVDEKLFKQLLRDQQHSYTRNAVQKAFNTWRTANEAKIQADVLKFLDKEIPAMVAKALPKLAKDFYCGIG